MPLKPTWQSCWRRKGRNQLHCWTPYTRRHSHFSCRSSMSLKTLDHKIQKGAAESCWSIIERKLFLAYLWQSFLKRCASPGWGTYLHGEPCRVAQEGSLLLYPRRELQHRQTRTCGQAKACCAVGDAFQDKAPALSMDEQAQARNIRARRRPVGSTNVRKILRKSAEGAPAGTMAGWQIVPRPIN